MATGHYSQWNARTDARAQNKGLRLDYFVCSDSMSEGVGALDVGEPVKHPCDDDDQIEEWPTAETALRILDCYILPDATTTSDHCGMVLEVVGGGAEGV